eukprot:SAG22_NODE_276_length_13167_cov_8.415825_13_plen_97_part_00
MFPKPPAVSCCVTRCFVSLAPPRVDLLCPVPPGPGDGNDSRSLPAETAYNACRLAEAPSVDRLENYMCPWPTCCRGLARRARPRPAGPRALDHAGL